MVSGIGSITKQFTAAALLKLWDNELTAKKTGAQTKVWFPDGIESRLEGFMPELKKAYPVCSELFWRIEQDGHYRDITLRDLLNHTHGLGARNDQQVMDLVVQSDGQPLAFSAIANTTEKRVGTKKQELQDEVYGKHQYGNFGYDLTGMVIEVVAKNSGLIAPEVSMDGEVFDAALHVLVLDPNDLRSTYTQTDTRASYYTDPSRFAIGYFTERPEGIKRIESCGRSMRGCQMALNLISNTRAAGGLKSTVGDLAKFAPQFMGAKMFENDEVKSAVHDRSKSVQTNRSNAEETYHLGIIANEDGTIGHSGSELTYRSDLRFNPQNGKVRAELKLKENLVDVLNLIPFA